MNKINSEVAKLLISREAEKSALDCEQSLFYPKLFKWEYLSSEVARVASAQKQTNTRPRNFAAQILSLTDFRAKQRLLTV